jgi:HAD superfamily hydrolase (TIGR01662 family)
MSLYIFDIDGTLIRSFMRESGEADDYNRVAVLDGRFEMIEKLAAEGAQFALVTNQAGVAMGYQTEDQVWSKIGRVIAEFDCFYRRPLSVHVCMEHPKARIERWLTDPCPRRKPEPGMLREALMVHQSRPAFFVGDMDSDREAARRCPLVFVHANDFFREER